MTWRVLVSAPYLLPAVEEFRAQLETAGVENVCVPVRERLSEAELLPLSAPRGGGHEHTERFALHRREQLKRVDLLLRQLVDPQAIEDQRLPAVGRRVDRALFFVACATKPVSSP